MTADEVARALAAVHGPDTVLGRLRWGTRFSDASRQVTAYRHGRVLFAGDAAHIHLPTGGQGLNLGVQDAMNLGWKLAATVRGRAPDGLLDSYHAERHPVGARVLANTRAQSVLMSPPPDADDVRALREIVIEMARLPDANRYLAGLMSGLDLRYDLGDPDPLVGARMIDLALRTGAGTRTVSELLRTGRGLLLELGGRARPGRRSCRPAVDRVAGAGARLAGRGRAGLGPARRPGAGPPRRLRVLDRLRPGRDAGRRRWPAGSAPGGGRAGLSGRRSGPHRSRAGTCSR